jgi:hypothetical protein
MQTVDFSKRMTRQAWKIFSILGGRIAYGIQAKRATKKRKPIKLEDKTALDVVQVEDRPLCIFKRVLPATVDYILSTIHWEVLQSELGVGIDYLSYQDWNWLAPQSYP